ncbi:hypothetical protein PTH_0291 [Pelotomaculum thermopropionicum SI]|uniref:Uncharacterized protein n=1 Tax=Pelotomaculum thermopropionicum (strain DSM 13744 / JCM 10971 / SI) TaxID=370438 RepID=A5D5L6_PELTS|nr:hypothetical protein PTH_0291 [Pelotomaculum thermopropionicum SI]
MAARNKGSSRQGDYGLGCGLACLMHQGDCVCGNALAFPGEAKPLGGGCLHADLRRLDLQRAGHSFLHLFYKRRKLRPLGHDHRIDIYNCQPLPGQDISHPGKQFHAANAFIPAVVVRKMPADIPRPGRAEKGVHNGMGQHVRVRVPQKPFDKRNTYAA